MKTHVIVWFVSLALFLCSARAAEPDPLAIKQALKGAGFYHGKVAGAHPKQLHDAICQYEEAHGLPVTGEVSPALLQGLGLANATAAAPVVQNPNNAVQPPATTGAIPATTPSAQLAPLIGSPLDQILSPLDQPATLPRNEVLQLRESFTDQMAKAPETAKAQYKAAFAVCVALLNSMDEREKAIADARTNHMPGVQDVHDARVSITKRGRAAQAAVRKENNENRQNQTEATQKNAFISADAEKEWGSRAIQLRQNIQVLYSREREAERQTPSSQ